METRQREQKRKRILEELRRLDQGSDVAYDMAMNDSGAAVHRLEAEKARLREELAKLDL